jgi:hypothetical protein
MVFFSCLDVHSGVAHSCVTSKQWLSLELWETLPCNYTQAVPRSSRLSPIVHKLQAAILSSMCFHWHPHTCLELRVSEAVLLVGVSCVIPCTIGYVRVLFLHISSRIPCAIGYVMVLLVKVSLRNPCAIGYMRVLLVEVSSKSHAQ